MDRYSRQVLFPRVGQEGQDRLAQARVAVIGCGALGSLHSEMLTRAGVGSLTIIDRDYVDWTNLQRQSLYDEDDARQGLPKAVAAARHLRAINSQLQLTEIVDDLNAGNALELLGRQDLLLDGTDNFETRFLINEVSVHQGIPWIYGACVGCDALTATFLPERPPCFHCLLEGFQLELAMPTCDTAGVIAPTVHWTASVQVTEALKILVGKRDELHRSILSWDAWRCHFRQVAMDGGGIHGCSVCRDRHFPALNGEKGTITTVLCGRNAVMLHPQRKGPFPLDQLEEHLAGVSRVTRNEYLVKAELGELELVVFADGRGVVRGTDDASVARSLYSRYVGS